MWHHLEVVVERIQNFRGLVLGLFQTPDILLGISWFLTILNHTPRISPVHSVRQVLSSVHALLLEVRVCVLQSDY